MVAYCLFCLFAISAMIPISDCKQAAHHLHLSKKVNASQVILNETKMNCQDVDQPQIVLTPENLSFMESDCDWIKESV